MSELQDELNELLRRIESMSAQQKAFSAELESLKARALKMHAAGGEAMPIEEAQKPTEPDMKVPLQDRAYEFKYSLPPVVEAAKPPKVDQKKSDNLEKFVGENLINKVGIAITILGVAFGAKYAIDHDMLSPVVRIALGYLLGAGLLFVSIRLKEKYKAYSAVLLGGAMSVFYLITFAAYSYYDFFPQLFTFVLMVAITAATVYASLKYDMQALAQIGLVGAYSVPFLLSDNSGRVVILFSYIALINIGILILAIRKSWKIVFYSAFAITWLIFGSWSLFERKSNQFNIAMFFLALYYVIFFVTFLSPAFIRNQILKTVDLILLIIIALLFFSIGMDIMASHNGSEHGLTVFKLANLVLPTIAYVFLVRTKSEDNSLHKVLFSLATVFLLLAVIDFFTCQWITIALSLLGLMYFYIGRVLGQRHFEWFAYPILLLAFLHLIDDWSISNSYHSWRPEYRSGIVFLNATFLASLCMTIVFSIVYRVRVLDQHKQLFIDATFSKIVRAGIPITLLALIYFSFRIELAGLFVEKYQWMNLQQEMMGAETNLSTQTFRKHALLLITNYSFIFLMVLALLNIRKLKNLKLGWMALAITVIAMLSFLTEGLLALRYLREELSIVNVQTFISVTGMRYISFAMILLLISTTYVHVRQKFFPSVVKIIFDCLMHLSILWMLSSELLRILEIYDSANMYKLGISILWGSYALLMIVLGIWKRMQHLRIMGMVIFAMTLVKLLLYDLDRLSTIAKAGLFILMGVFLLLVSYLYLRFKNKISGEEDGGQS